MRRIDPLQKPEAFAAHQIETIWITAELQEGADNPITRVVVKRAGIRENPGRHQVEAP